MVCGQGSAGNAPETDQSQGDFCMNSTVDFVIAGCAKSGTTALTLMLDQHPAIYTSDIKETNFFIQGFEPTRHFMTLNGKCVLDDQEEDDIIDTPEKYQGLFKSAGKDQIKGEASPWYLLNADVPARMLSYNPDVKVILTLRNPSDVAFANFVHQVRDRAESIGIDNMEAFLNAARYQDQTLHPFCNHLDLPRYSKHLPAYLSTIPRENLHIMIYEEFRDNKQQALAEVFEFLGVAPQENIEVDRSVNISGLPKHDWLQDRIQGSMAFKKALGLIIPKKPRRRLRAYIEAKNTGKQVTLSPQHRRRLDDEYAEDRRYVESLLGRPVESWEQRLAAPSIQLAMQAQG
jgi:hypothetical protein